MAQFSTRVELHNADWNDYVKLHAAMKLRGFSQTIKADDGKTYELPPAEYDYIGAVTRADVLTKALAAAGTVKVSHAVIVTESNGRTWQGLGFRNYRFHFLPLFPPAVSDGFLHPMRSS